MEAVVEAGVAHLAGAAVVVVDIVAHGAACLPGRILAGLDCMDPEMDVATRFHPPAENNWQCPADLDETVAEAHGVERRLTGAS